MRAGLISHLASLIEPVLTQVQQYRQQQGGGRYVEPEDCPSNGLKVLLARVRHLKLKVGPPSPHLGGGGARPRPSVGWGGSHTIGAPSSHLGGGGAPLSPLTPSPFRLGGGADTRGGKGRYLLQLEDKVSRVRGETEEILSTAVFSDRDAAEASQRASNLKRRMDKLDGELNTKANQCSSNDVVSHLYDLRATLGDLQERLDENVSRTLRSRGMQAGDVRPNVSRPKVFTGSGTPLDFLDWRKAAERFHAACRLSEEQQLHSYQNELTAGMAKEMISQLKSTAAIVKMLTDRYGSKMGLVDGFKAELLSIKRPDQNKDAAAADYVTAALSKLQYLLRLAREENLVYELAMLRCEQVVLNVMRSHTALKPFEMMFGGMYGDAAEASGFVSAENTFEILLTCLRKADKALLYVKTTQNTHTPHDATSKKDNSGGNNSGGGKRDNKKNGKQINQTAGSKKQQGNGGNSNGGNSNNNNNNNNNN